MEGASGTPSISKITRKFERMFPGCAVNSELMQEFTSGGPATEIDKENAIFLGYLQDDFKNKKETFIPASEQPE